jgi:hypothetical protein
MPPTISYPGNSPAVPAPAFDVADLLADEDGDRFFEGADAEPGGLKLT